MNRIKAIILCIVVALSLFAVGCNGESAYDIAIRNGYKGTEQQWLLSLQGKDGADGKDISIDDIFALAKENGFEGTYFDFVREYMTFIEAPDDSAATTKGLQSALLVYCEFEKVSHSLFGSVSGISAQAGAGVIYSINKEQESAYIVTNYHVIYNEDSGLKSNISDKITLISYGGQEISATYLGGSAKYDIAVLQATNSYFASEIATQVTIADSNSVSVGQAVIAIGNPAGGGISATQGIISVDSEYITMSAIDDPSSSVTMRVMRMDAPVNEGNSGGGLFDSKGDLIGIVNAKSADTSIENIAYAIPSAIVSAVADNIIKNKAFKESTINVTFGIKDSKAYLDDNGLIKISETVTVSRTSGTAKGKLISGDTVLSITVDNKETLVSRHFHITDALLRAIPGDTITFKVLRKTLGIESEMEVNIVCS